MSLRDYFAAAALQGFLANGAESQKCLLIDPLTSSDKRCMTDSEFAECCYHYADAMLAAREAEGT